MRLYLRPPLLTGPIGINRRNLEQRERMPYSELFQKMVLLRATRSQVLVLPEDTCPHQAEELFRALDQVMAGPPMVVIGPVQVLDEAAMNAAGWYRK
ncbi:hypothetical protein [Pseudomonas sp. URMO17WK12:I4]|uniref:hypothetical protein n=1 Tax=Pseudomonas sp. URMO17WK12:I4 TaxID=1283292 RepID=UPI0015A5CB17|nr:hypothetical protein [Pseudomonas sp. URMO17WK12:I4]